MIIAYRLLRIHNFWNYEPTSLCMHNMYVAMYIYKYIVCACCTVVGDYIDGYLCRVSTFISWSSIFLSACSHSFSLEQAERKDRTMKVNIILCCRLWLISRLSTLMMVCIQWIWESKPYSQHGAHHEQKR